MDYAQRRRNLEEIQALSRQEKTPERKARMEELVKAIGSDELKDPGIRPRASSSRKAT